jgi:hypothetical protein
MQVTHLLASLKVVTAQKADDIYVEGNMKHIVFRTSSELSQKTHIVIGCDPTGQVRPCPLWMAPALQGLN